MIDHIPLVSPRKNYAYQELQWMRVTNNPDTEIWSAHSADHVRSYTAKLNKKDSNGNDIEFPVWYIAWRITQNDSVAQCPIAFRTIGEAKETVQHIENTYDLDLKKLKDISASNQVTVGGNKWVYYGIQANKRLWICVLPGDKITYVAMFDYDNPDLGWTVTKREWISVTEGPDTGKEKLKITEIASKIRTEVETHMSVALLTHSSSSSSPTKISEIPPE